MRLSALDAGKIAEYRKARLSAGRAPDTIRLELALLGPLFDVSSKEWQVGLTLNPVRRVKQPAGRVRDHLLSWSEIKRLLKAAKADSQPMIMYDIRVAMQTAKRYGAIVGLRVQDIDFSRRILYVYAKAAGPRKKQAVPLSVRACRTL